jgi:hypothetical protein
MKADMTDAPLQLEQYSPYLHQIFFIYVEPGITVEAELVEAEILTNTDSVHNSPRKPFTLIFRLQDGVELTQRLYEVGHESVGKHALFLVPIHAQQPGRFMQAIFN